VIDARDIREYERMRDERDAALAEVEWLRAELKEAEGVTEHTVEVNEVLKRDLVDAKAEAEWLRAELKQRTAASAERTQMDGAEVERLRQVLQEAEQVARSEAADNRRLRAELENLRKDSVVAPHRILPDFRTAQ